MCLLLKTLISLRIRSAACDDPCCAPLNLLFFSWHERIRDTWKIIVTQCSHAMDSACYATHIELLSSKSIYAIGFTTRITYKYISSQQHSTNTHRQCTSVEKLIYSSSFAAVNFYIFFFSFFRVSLFRPSTYIYRTTPCQCVLVAWALCMCIYLQATKLYFILGSISLYRRSIYIKSLNKSLCFFHRWLLFWYFPFFIFLSETAQQTLLLSCVMTESVRDSDDEIWRWKFCVQ